MNVGRCAKSLDFSPKLDVEDVMSDADLAADLLDEVIGTRGVREPVKSMLERAYSELSRLSSAWTRRRVRAVFNREANRIEHREIEDMKAVIEARKRHGAYRQETADLIARALNHSADQTGGHGQRQGFGLG